MEPIFALSGLINGVLALGFAVFVIISNRRSKANKIYFLLGIAITIWSFGYWRWQSSNDEASALFWIRILSIGSTVLPVLFFHWVVLLLGLEKKQKKVLILIYFAVAIFLLFSFSNLFISGVREKSYFHFWPDPGILYHFYLFFVYLLSVLYSIFLLLKNYRNSSEERKAQIIYVLIAIMVGFGGGLTNFFLWYDIQILPYGTFLVALYPLFLGYASLKYHMFDAKVIATETLTLAVWVFLFIKTILSSTPEEFLMNMGLLICLIIAGVLLIRSVLKEVRQREQIEKMAKEIKEAYELEKKARKELERLDDAKSQFMMATQHHLRTPLTSIRGYLDLLLSGSFGKVSPKIKDVIGKIQISSNRLIRIVNEFLDVSQFQLGKDVVMLEQNVDIMPIINEITEELNFEAKAKGIYLKVEKPKEIPKIKADGEKLKMALFNLFDNGIKYTNKGGVTIKLEVVNNKFRIIIKDTGVGIPKGEQKNLFNRVFERGKSAKKTHGTGRGIGLYISSHIIKSHNGKIWAESNDGEGSTFYVELPIK